MMLHSLIKLQFRLYSANKKDAMNSDQFAKLLLQSTYLDEQDVKEYLERLESRLQSKIVSCCCYCERRAGHIVWPNMFLLEHARDVLIGQSNILP
jgi:hypothetical protein